MPYLLACLLPTSAQVRLRLDPESPTMEFGASRTGSPLSSCVHAHNIIDKAVVPFQHVPFTRFTDADSDADGGNEPTGTPPAKLDRNMSGSARLGLTPVRRPSPLVVKMQPLTAAEQADAKHAMLVLGAKAVVAGAGGRSGARRKAGTTQRLQGRMGRGGRRRSSTTRRVYGGTRRAGSDRSLGALRRTGSKSTAALRSPQPGGSGAAARRDFEPRRPEPAWG